ncbi:MAG: GspE/PulE family protein [Verrucomicrobiota bacterium]
MSKVSESYLSKVLEQCGLFSGEQIADLVEQTRTGDSSITEVVVSNEYASEEAFLKSVADVMNLSFVRVGNEPIDTEVLDKLSTKTVFQHNVLPISFENGILTVACKDPFDLGLVDTLRIASGARVKLALSSSADINKAVTSFYGVGADTVDRMMSDGRYEVAPEEELSKTDLGQMDQEASIVKFVNQIIWEACEQGATDIHFEPMENELRIRYRIDGVLHQTPVPQQLNRFQAAIISRIKVMANMDIAEKRLPMDGRIGLRVGSEDIDIRVSTMPTVYGESVSLRLLQKSSEFISLTELGLSDYERDVVKKIIHKPNGIVLVTGPTGSGKSTSLYAFLNEINQVDRRILTAEEPIEYEMEGINQLLVRPQIGLSFARALRSFLRQDPDIIMIGEIRDVETAEMAIQASLTGHLVFSTLHTNDAAGAFTRLLDMGVEPYLIASAVEAVIAQRLVRRLCPDCRRDVAPDKDFLDEIGLPADGRGEDRVFEPNGCEKCRDTGFRGRVGIFETLQATDDIESLVVTHSSTHIIKHKAIEQGMRTLREDGWAKVRAGVTSIEEVLRVTEEAQETAATIQA